MSLRIETLNEGSVEDFGFSYGGVHRVLLGELPAMPTPQFCELAGKVLLEISEKLDEQDWVLLGKRLQLAFVRDEQTKVNKESIFDVPEDLPVQKVSREDVSDEILGALLENISLPKDLADRLEKAGDAEKRIIFDSLIANLIIQNGWIANPYSNSPFEIREDHVSIGGVYELSLLEFGSFVAQILAGGFFGWDQEKGMPKAAKETIRRLKQMVMFF